MQEKWGSSPAGQRDRWLTGEIGLELQDQYRAYNVFYDHGPEGPNCGRISAWIDVQSGHDAVPHEDTRLCLLDIAIVRGACALVLVEIEETTGRPKTLLGDVFSTAFAQHIGFGGQAWETGQQTTLIVMGKGAPDERLRYLNEKMKALRTHLATVSGNLGHVVIDSFVDSDDLRSKLRGHIEMALLNG